MAVLRSLLPRLGLFLCLGLCFSPAFSESSNDSCMDFDKVFPANNSGIQINASVSEQNTTYTVWVPVNNEEVRAVILKVVNQNNNSVGSWDGASQECNDTGVLYQNLSNLSFLEANWTVPNSEDVTNLNLQVFIIDLNRTATMSSVRLEQQKIPTELTPTPLISWTTTKTTDNTVAKIEDQTSAQTTAQTIAQTTAQTTNSTTDYTTAFTTNQTTDYTTAKRTTAQTTDYTTAKRTTAQTTDYITAKRTTAQTTDYITAKRTTAQTTDYITAKRTTAQTTARSLAIRALSSPLAGAIHILLVFLISKLLF